jgi:hypothetical protein
MSGQGTTTIDFGAFPGKTDVTVDIVASGITGLSLAEAWLFPAATADHTVDEHLVDGPRVFAHTITAGVGFKITAISSSSDETDFLTYGLWSVAWVYN